MVHKIPKMCVFCIAKREVTYIVPISIDNWNIQIRFP